MNQRRNFRPDAPVQSTAKVTSPIMRLAGVDTEIRLAAALLLAVGACTPLRAEAPPKTEADPRQHNCPWLGDIFDDQELPTRAENREEYFAYNNFVRFARRFSTEQLAKYSRPELTWNILHGKERSKYRGEIVHVEGRMKRLAWIGSNRDLAGDGIKDLYEAWIYPNRNDWEHAICLILSEIPAGLKPEDEYSQSIDVVADGYFFKRYKYRSKKGVALAPLVLGHTLTVKPAAASSVDEDTEAFMRSFLPVMFTVVAGVVVSAVVMHRWYRRGDQRAQEHLRSLQSTEFIAPTEP